MSNNGSSTSEKMQTHGWDILVIPTQALIDLNSREYKLYNYLVFRGRDEESSFPGIARIAADLTSPDEKWSQPTVKRALTGLSEKHYIIRQRRYGSSSITHIFKSTEACKKYAEQIANEPSISSPVIQSSDHPRSDIKNTQYKENTDQSITPPPNGAVLDSSKPPKQRTDLEKAIITEIFALPADTPFDEKQSRKRKGLGFQVGQLHNFIKREYPSHTAVEVGRFKTYYQNAPESKNAAMVTDLTKFEGHYRRFAVALEKKKAAQAAAKDYVPPPRPTVLTKEEREAALKRIEEINRERLQK